MKMKKMTRVYALLFILFYGANSVCMEVVPLNRASGLILDKESLALEIVLLHGTQWLNHQALCSLAINKKCDETLCKTAKNRKEYLINLAKEGESPSYLLELTTWHKYGSACGERWLTMICQEYQLRLNYWFLADGKVTRYESKPWHNFDARVPCLPRVRFNADGDLYCYGWSKEEGMLWCTRTQLTEYCLLQDGTLYARKCGLDIGKPIPKSLFFFKSLPVLLKAFVNSSVGYQTDTMKVYNLKDAQIPADYKKYEPSFFNPTKNSFDDLREDIQTAIVERYNTQHNQAIKK